MLLKEKHIVVTGGAGGIGGLLCEKLLAEGAKVTVVDRVESLPFQAELLRGDLSTLDGVAQLAEAMRQRRVDILINLAGIQYFGPLEQQAPAHVALSYAINLVAPVLLTQAVLQQMKQRGEGRIVNIGSTFGSINFAHFVTYSSAKAGLRAFSEALRRELAGSGIGVTYIAPRAVKTKLNNEKVLQFAKLTKMHMDEPEWVAEKIIQAIKDERKDVFLGFPEKFFVRLNALLPRLVDGALQKNDRLAASLFKPSEIRKI